MSSISRRSVLVGAVGVAGAALAGQLAYKVLRQPRATVTTLRLTSYDADLVDPMLRAIQAYPAVVARAKGARVVLKPNLVEYDHERPINTDPRFIAAVAEVFRTLGASSVIVAEGPGHRRDTELILEQTRLRGYLDDLRLPFVDLNIDEVKDVALPTNYTGLGSIKLGGAAATADLLVSLPKLKTHHWAGCTLSMKNLFGTVPGSVYGWPKNPLHVAGIDRSIVDLWAALRPGFTIVDGIVGMEGDGPLMGTAKPMGVVVMGDNLPAVDATSARLMGLDPDKIAYLRVAADHGGTVAPSRIRVEGDHVEPSRFEVLDHLEPMYL